MASLPDRESKDAVRSVCDQVDDFHRYLGTGFPGDANKFRGVIGMDGYLMTFDDDIIYPDDYVPYMLSKVKEYDHKAIITLHGKKLNEQPDDFYYMNCVKYRCLWGVRKDGEVHIPGTGVMAWHSSLTPDLSMEIFDRSNMADILFGAFCEVRGIPRVCVKHSEGWLLGHKYEDNLYDNNKERSEELSEALKEIEWDI